MYKIGIVGYGYVGKGMHRMFEDWVTAIYSPNLEDKDVMHYPASEKPEEARAINLTKEAFKEVDLAIVCVPTAMKENGQCDTTIVDETIGWLHEQGVKYVLIKSTIEPGTTFRLQAEYRDMAIVFSPEYMGEGKYFTPPWQYPDPVNPISHGFMVLGGGSEASEKIAGIFIKKMGPHTKFVFLNSKQAEIVKYWENMWGAMKVIFSNQMYDYIKVLDPDSGSYHKIREGWAADPRVERMHTAVFEQARGFSGKCYPKDLRAFIYAVEQAGGNPELLKTIWNINCDYRPNEFKKIK